MTYSILVDWHTELDHGVQEADMKLVIPVRERYGQRTIIAMKAWRRACVVLFFYFGGGLAELFDLTGR